MSETDKYFQFPLCLLAHGADVNERLNDIIGYAAVEAGRVMWVKWDDRIRAAKADEIASTCDIRDFNADNEQHVAAMIGAAVTNVNPGSMSNILKEHKTAHSFIWPYESKYGKDVRVRIKAEYVWEVLRGGQMSYREFSVLCALYSAIGASKHPHRITRDLIRARALGYKSPKIMQAEIKARKDKAQPLTEWQVRSTLNTLHAIGHFYRCHASPRQTFYSHRLNDDELRLAVFRRKTYMAQFRAEQAAKDRELAEKIKAATENHRQTTTIIASSPESTKEPPSDHRETTIRPPL